jgi:excisionase family DNA binding protein
MIKEFLKPSELAHFYGVSQGAIYAAIHKGRLKAERQGTRWVIPRSSIHDYARTRYSRAMSRYKDGPLFDRDKGECSVVEAAKALKCHVSCVYHYCRQKMISMKRKGKAYVLNMDEVMRFKETYRK